MSLTESKKWYNSHGEFMTVGTFIDLEVTDRCNMDMRAVEEAFKEGGIKVNNNDMCIWVTSNPIIAASYSDAGEINEIDTSEGVILDWTDDGDEGFLFVQRPIKSEKDEPKKLKILRADFINWYFEDETISAVCEKTDLISDLIYSGESIVDAQDLLDNCGYIPRHITFNPEAYPEEYEPEGSEYEMKLNKENFTYKDCK